MASSRFERPYRTYQNFIVTNPVLSGEIETALKWLSYLSTGLIDKNGIVSELLYSCSTLLTIVNDRIIRKSMQLPHFTDQIVENLNTFLAVIEVMEVFAESIAAQFGGPTKRWIVIVVIQLAKWVLHLVLLFRFKQGMQPLPSISLLDRKHDLSSQQGDCDISNTFTLKNSGRTIRTIHSTPPMHQRNWEIPQAEEVPVKNQGRLQPSKLSDWQLTGEVLHLSRPLIHLFSVFIYGQKTWKPWIISFACDLMSLQLYGGRKNLHHDEKIELSRRALMLILYSLRTPCYETYSEARIINTIKLFPKYFPPLKLIEKPLKEYIPHWQSTYFYCWTR